MTPERRQQVDRTSATRAAVLEATVALLFERGYAGTSTRLAAERAGVSLGALQHHFHTKAELSVEAMRFLVRRLADEFLAASPGASAEPERFEAVLDRLWVVFRGPSGAAGLELLVAARTDPDLAAPMRELHRDVEQVIAAGATELLPELASRPGFDALLTVAIASLRGLALITLDPEADVSPAWGLVRTSLLDAGNRLHAGEHA